MESPKLSWSQEWLKSPKYGYIGGEWLTSSASSRPVINPSNRKVLGSLGLSSQQDVDHAVTSARSAFRDAGWRRLSPAARSAKLQQVGQLIREHRAELATLEALSNGKLYREAFEDDLPDSASVFDYYAGWTNKLYGETCPVEPGFLNYTLREPVGVVGLIVPWNFPLLMACWKLAPALAMGNTVVIKPATFTSLTLIRTFELIHQAGIFPPGVLNLILGDSDAGDQLTSHQQVDKISFTGSTAVGRKIVHNSSASNLKAVSLELGGKSPNIVFDDVPDLQYAMERSFNALFSHKGEKCSEPTRFYVHRSHYEAFLEYFAKRAAAIRCGDPFDATSQQGAQCHEDHYNKILRYIDIGKAEGARLVVGGSADTAGSNKDGFFVRPTVFADVPPTSALSRDEIFGPVLAISSFSTEDEVIELANNTSYGLAAGFWTKDVSRAHRVAERLDAGMIFINQYGCYDFCSPFGGFKESGWGKDMAIHSLDAYTRTKSVWLKFQ